jgi:uncharacterized protein
MDLVSTLIIVLGLCVFEIVNSIDNAIINAEVLSTMSERAKRWFLFWGMLFAVFIIRGLLPWIIVWVTVPHLGPIGSLTATFSNDPQVLHAIEASAPILLVAGGTFLVFLFLHWLFAEQKNFGLYGEEFFLSQALWFYAVSSAVLCLLVWFALSSQNHMMAFAAVIGSAAYFLTHGFKQNAERSEQQLMKQNLSDIHKILYLEVIDATFSIDGVLGAFAFTLAVPLIILGNGIGAYVVRHITVGNIKNIKKYRYLKNGAMYSILCLGSIMILDGFGVEIPSWIAPALTFIVVGAFLLKSIAVNKLEQKAQ